MQISWLRSLLLWSGRAAAIYLVFQWVTHSVVPTFNRTDTRRDMVLYYRAARAVNVGASLYTPRPNYGPDSKPFEYLYPPPFAAAIAPLGRLNWLTFARLWTVGLIVAFVGYALCLSALSGRGGFWWFLGWLAVLRLCPGTTRAMSLGQIDPALWLLSGLGVWAIALPSSAGRAVGGTALGAVSLVKIYAAWPLFAVGKSEARAQIWGTALLVGALGLALGAWRCGLDAYPQWAHAVLPVAGQGTFNPDNFSFSMGVLRAARVVGWDYGGGPLTGLPKLWLSVAAIAGPLGALWGSRRLDLRWRVALITCVAAWCAPLCWSTYLPLALLPLALGLSDVVKWSELASQRNSTATGEVETVNSDLN